MCARRPCVWVCALVVLLGVCAAPATSTAEPRLFLRTSTFATEFPNGSSVVMPAVGYGDLELLVQDALADISVSSVRVMLNQTPMATFLTINRMPRGVRVIVKMGASLNRDFNLRPDAENLITLDASDTSSVGYHAQFYIATSPEATAPVLAAHAPSRPAVRDVASPTQAVPPKVTFTSAWPERTANRVVLLEADVADIEGLRRIVIEVNSSATEEVVLENEFPVRKQRGFIAKGRLPGSVTGSGRKISIAIPITLEKRLNTVGIRVESLVGLRAYADRTIELTTVK